MYKSHKGTRYESETCGCGNPKKVRSKYCMKCSRKLNNLRAKCRCKDLEIRELNKKELEYFIKINNL